MTQIIRCEWVKTPLDIPYHDSVWGQPEHDDHKLFYMLILEGMQAGLSWSTILGKWANFFEAFDQFNPNLIAQYGPEKIASLMDNQGIIRNRLKINAAITNANLFLDIQSEYGSFDRYIWHFVQNTPIQNNWHTAEEVPAYTPLSEKISKELKKKGFKFVGPTIIYAYMQAIGMVNDHLVSCHCYQTCQIK